MVKRFVDNNWFYFSYAHHEKVWVKCPKCHSLAFVWREKIDDDYITRCVCTNCMFRVNEIVTDTFVYNRYWHSVKTLQGYFGKVKVMIDEKCPCKEGKFRFEKIYANKSQIPNCINVNCNFCGTSKDFYSKSDDVKIQHADSVAIDTDPFLDFPLYLSKNTSLGKIFALNPKQLTQFKAYISADLRENTHFHKSYFSRMPTWIKSAKNRDLVLKAIGKLEQKIASTNQFSP